MHYLQREALLDEFLLVDCHGEMNKNGDRAKNRRDAFFLFWSSVRRGLGALLASLFSRAAQSPVVGVRTERIAEKDDPNDFLGATERHSSFS